MLPFLTDLEQIELQTLNQFSYKVLVGRVQYRIKRYRTWLYMVKEGCKKKQLPYSLAR